MMMKMIFLCLCFFTGVLGGSEYELSEVDSDPRLLFPNITLPVIQFNNTALAYALVVLAILAAVGTAIVYLFLEAFDSSESNYGYSGYNNNNYNYARSNTEAPSEFNYLSILKWISMLQEVYEKFDYNDLECQKRLICEVMKEPEYFGTAAEKFKSGFQYAKYLEVISLPDDLRDLLDEYLDANARSEQKKDCQEFFKCPYSLKDSLKRNYSEDNSL